MSLEKSSLKRNPDFLSHLEEFRRRLIFCVGVFLILAGVCYFFSKPLLDLLIAPLRDYQEIDLYFVKPYEAFLTRIKVAALSGLVLAIPVFFSQMWLFVSPGLYAQEKKIAFPLILVSAILFFTGAFFAYRIVVPLSLNFLLSFQTDTLKPLLGVSPYFSFLLGMVLAFGLVFDFPVILLGLIRLGTVNTQMLKKARKLVIILIFITAAILTPPDPVSQALLALPLILLFEISIVVGRWVEKKQPPDLL